MADSNVISFEAERSKQLASANYVNVFNLIYSKWSRELTPAQITVLQFINIRTFKYGKSIEKIPARHFLEGVYSREGNQIHAGIGISQSTLKRALRGLGEQGLVHAHRKGRGTLHPTEYAIDFKMLERGPDMSSKLRMPKNLKGVTMNPSRGHNEPFKGSQRAIEYTDSNKQIITSRNVPPTGGADGLSGAITAATSRNREKRRHKRSTLNAKITKSGVKALWQDLMIPRYPDEPMLFVTDKEWGRFKSQYNTIDLHGHTIVDVLTWIVDEWERLMDNEMSWVRKYTPNVYIPTMELVVKYFRRFVEVYASEASRRKKEDGVAAVQRLRQSREQAEPKGPTLAEVQAENERLRRELAHTSKVANLAIRRANKAQQLADASPEPVDYSDDKWDLPEWEDLEHG